MPAFDSPPETADQSPDTSPSASPNATTRRGAIGKALLVWLFSGSLGIAVIAFIIFSMMGC